MPDCEVADKLSVFNCSFEFGFRLKNLKCQLIKMKNPWILDKINWSSSKYFCFNIKFLTTVVSTDKQTGYFPCEILIVNNNHFYRTSSSEICKASKSKKWVQS